MTLPPGCDGSQSVTWRLSSCIAAPTYIVDSVAARHPDPLRIGAVLAQLGQSDEPIARLALALAPRLIGLDRRREQEVGHGESQGTAGDGERPAAARSSRHLAALRRHYGVAFAATAEGWRMVLTPLSLRVLGAVQRITVTGQGDALRGVETEGGGGVDRMRIAPAP